jgi:hypothetical protein
MYIVDKQYESTRDARKWLVNGERKGSISFEKIN